MKEPGAAVVGLTAGLVEACWGPWRGPAFLVAAGYVAAVERAGAVAVLLAAGPAATQAPDVVVDRVDALVLTGGCDVDPDAYGQVRQPETGLVDRGRDDFEIALVRAALARDLPVLATCRGMQVLNVAFGGTLRQHLSGREGAAHRLLEGTWTRHRVDLAAGSLAARATGEERPRVDSHHHQALDRVAPGFAVTGRAGDGVIEAIEAPSRRFALGVQWHPEEDAASGLIAALVEALREQPGDDRPVPCTGR